MSDLLNQVTPLTRGLIWLLNEPTSPSLSNYKDIDYLLNGLLTATLKNGELPAAQVIISNSFGKSFLVLVATTLQSPDAKSYFRLLAPHLNEESNVIVIDDAGKLEALKKEAPVEIRNRFKVL